MSAAGIPSALDAMVRLMAGGLFGTVGFGMSAISRKTKWIAGAVGLPVGFLVVLVVSGFLGMSAGLVVGAVVARIAMEVVARVVEG